MNVQIRRSEFQVDTSLHPVYWQIINDGKWEQETFEIVDYFVRESDVVMDMGCWIGPLSFYMATKCTRVFSIDPDPVAYESFIKSWKMNPSFETKITPFNIAIAPKSGKINLNAREEYGASSTSILNRTRDSQHSCEVEGVTFSEFIQANKISHLDFIKMDIEGGEFEVLPGMQRELEKLGFPAMYISFHYGHLNEAIYRERVKNKWIARAMMKIEKITGLYFFKTQLINKINPVLPAIRQYNFVYDEFGNPVQANQFTPGHLLSNSLNLVVSNTEWLKT